jgi:hypothetical protein
MNEPARIVVQEGKVGGGQNMLELGQDRPLDADRADWGNVQGSRSCRHVKEQFQTRSLAAVRRFLMPGVPASISFTANAGQPGFAPMSPSAATVRRSSA